MVNESRGLVALVHRLRKGEEELMSGLMRHVVNLVKWGLGNVVEPDTFFGQVLAW